MTGVLLSVHGVVWGIPMLVLILGVGLWITVHSGFAQLRFFPAAVREFLRSFRNRDTCSGSSSFRALCTALGATVGTGNIVGVAGAICMGGPGAIFWMWICGLLAMGTKFAEAVLAVRYRRGTEQFEGGPMYMITDGLPQRWHFLAVFYCFFGVIAAFGVGNAVQVNAVISGINSVLLQWGHPETMRRNLAMGLILAVVAGSVLMGGAERIGAAAEMLVPFVSLFYIGLCVCVLILRSDRIAAAFYAILQGAFSPHAVTGGAVGTVLLSLRVGCSRGVFTNEAGMGTASIAHAGADVSHPVQQGLMGIMEVFLDTIVLCTLTALVILVSGISVPYGRDLGGSVTIAAFSGVCGDWVCIALAASLCCFAFATILGWGLYGSRCAQFLFGPGVWQTFAFAQTAAVIVGAVLKTETLWLMAELFNGLMAIPNLIALAALTPELSRLIKEYIKKEGGAAAEGGNHADFHQCQPLRAFPHEKVPSLRGGGGSAGKEDLSSEYWSA